MTEHEFPYPHYYASAIRRLLRYALFMLVIGLLSGIAFQESVKRIDRTPSPNGLSYWDAALRLALVHGHILVTAVLFPIAMASVLHLARAYGGAEVSRRALKWAVNTYLPFVTLTVGLMLYKGYHVLLAVRAGATDMAQIDADFFGGGRAMRHAVYGLSHGGMALGLCLFAWCVWRSLKGKGDRLL